jgi:hypothetical protein
LFEEEGFLAIEVNPVANWLLEEFGWAGMAALKFGTMLTVLGLVRLIAHWRPQASFRILTFGCLLVGGVVVYSALLLGAPQLVSRASSQEERAGLEQMHQLIAEQRERSRRLDLREALVRDVLAKRLTFLEAVAVQSERDVDDPVRTQNLRLYFPGDSDGQRIAMNLMRHLLVNSDSLVQRQALARELGETYQQHFGVPVPASFWEDCGGILKARDEAAQTRVARQCIRPAWRRGGKAVPRRLF